MKKTLFILLLIGLLAGLASGAFALFTSSASVPANTFTTGTVVLSTSPSSALIAFSVMAPGDQVTAPLTVSNDGTLQLRYAMTSSSTDTDGKGLMNQLVLNIKTGVTTCTNAGFGLSGTSIYSGALASAAVGDPTPGGQSGDRTLNASANEVLCFNASLPIGTGDAYQNATTTATFTFQGEQTANNP
jgi:spore coat-associated protein N